MFNLVLYPSKQATVLINNALTLNIQTARSKFSDESRLPNKYN